MELEVTVEIRDSNGDIVMVENKHVPITLVLGDDNIGDDN